MTRPFRINLWGCACRAVVVLGGLSVFCAAQTAGKDCAISGEVVSSADGLPLPQAEVTVTPAGADGGTGRVSRVVRVAGDGKFAIDALSPGRFRLKAKKEGFAGMEYGARRPGRSGVLVAYAGTGCLSGITFRLPPLAVIAGRVLDEQGKPVRDAEVGALKVFYRQGVRTSGAGGDQHTNDLGEYRIFGLPPGEYWICAGPPTGPKVPGPAPRETYGNTCYPRATAWSQGASVHLYPGAVMPGMDIVLRKRPTVNVSGHVMGYAKRPVKAQVALLALESQAGGYSFSSTDSDGAFEFRDVEPGSYRIEATAEDGGSVLVSADTVVAVAREDIKDVKVLFTPASELAGRVYWVEGEGKLPPWSLSVMLIPKSGDRSGYIGGLIPRVEVDKTGSFVLKGVAHEEYWFTLDGLPEDYYIRSVRMGEVDVLDKGIFPAGGRGAPLDVAVSNGAGAVQGTVRNDRQEPVQGATVVLIPRFSGRESRFEFHRFTDTDQNGSFMIRGLDPGEYVACAWYDIEPGAWMGPASGAAAKGKAVRLTVREKSMEKADLEAVDAQ